MQASRRASPGRQRLVGVEVGRLDGAGQDGVVEGHDHGGCALVVQVVCGEVLEELGEGEAARRCRQSNDRSTPTAESGSRILRGAVIASMTLPRIAAASAGMVKWPVVVPSPLSCSVSEHFSRAACSWLRMSSFSWASTIFWSGSTASIARRARRRSWSGLKRAAFLHQTPSRPHDAARRSPLLVVGRSRARSPRREPGETSPASRASAVASCPVSQLTRQRNLSGCVGTGDGGGLREPLHRRR